MQTTADKVVWCWVLVVLGLATACQPTADEDAQGRRLLAKVGNRTLYLSEMEGMFPRNATREDSSLVMGAYVDRWVKEAVLLDEAERNLPPDLNIDKLVRDYRASLIRSNYERVLVEQLLDSVVSQAELQEFYEANKDQYQLETPIVRCYFIKLPAPAPDGARLRQLWNSQRPEDLAELKAYCERVAEVALLDDSLWYSVEEISDLLPQGTITPGNVGAKKEFTQQDGQYQYYFRLFEQKNRQDIAPLGYIQEQARKVILHKRKLQLLEDVKRNMYERELRRNNIETFIE